MHHPGEEGRTVTRNECFFHNQHTSKAASCTQSVGNNSSIEMILPKAPHHTNLGVPQMWKGCLHKDIAIAVCGTKI